MPIVARGSGHVPQPTGHQHQRQRDCPGGVLQDGPVLSVSVPSKANSARTASASVCRLASRRQCSRDRDRAVGAHDALVLKALAWFLDFCVLQLPSPGSRMSTLMWTGAARPRVCHPPVGRCLTKPAAVRPVATRSSVRVLSENRAQTEPKPPKSPISQALDLLAPVVARRLPWRG